MSQKKSFTAGFTTKGKLGDAGKTLRQAEAGKTWNLDYVPIDKLMPNKLNEHYPQNSITALATSIQRNGLMHNLVAIPEDNGNFRILSGERRYRAIKSLPQEDYKRLFPSGIPVKIEDTSIDIVDEEIHLIEANCQDRGDGFDEDSDLSPNERYAAWLERKRWEVERLKELYAKKNINYSATEITKKIAENLNISTRQVYKYAATNKLIPELDSFLLERKINLNQGSKIGNLQEDAQLEVYNILMQYGKISDEQIKTIKKNISERETQSATLIKELEDAKIKLEKQEALISTLNSQIKQSGTASTSVDIEELVFAKNKLEKDNNALLSKIESLFKEKENLEIKPKQLTAEEVQKAKSELQISQSVTTIENALKILEKNKDYIQDSNYLAKILKLKDNIEDLLTI